jgi:hypothetical protein
MTDDFVLPAPVLQPLPQSAAKPSTPSGERVSTPNVIHRGPATSGAAVAPQQPVAHGQVLGRGRQIQAMQVQLGDLQKELSSIFDGTNKDLANLMNHYDSYVAKNPAFTTPFFDHLRSLTGLGRTAQEQADGSWGGKTSQAIGSVAQIATSLSKLSHDLGAKGQDLQEIGKSLAGLLHQAEQDPTNAERKYAPEIGVQLQKMQASMEAIRQHASEASKQLGTVLMPQKPSMVRNVDPKTGKVDPFGVQGLIDYGNDTGLIYRDQVMGNIPVSYADLKNLNTFKKHFARYINAPSTTGGGTVQDESTQLRAIINNLMQQADQQLEQFKHPNSNQAGI